MRMRHFVKADEGEDDSPAAKKYSASPNLSTFSAIHGSRQLNHNIEKPKPKSENSDRKILSREI